MDTHPDPPFIRIGPDGPATPVVLSVPHSGRAYSPALLSAARLPRERLETLEDPLVDQLVWRAVAAGAVAFVAHAPRAEIDLNRDERELDPATIDPPPPAALLIQSPRTRGGLGLIPSRIAGSGAIWCGKVSGGELARRINEVHRPYHAAVADALAAARERFGAAILLDCHSMPPRGAREPAIVFGDRHGMSIAPDLIEAAVDAAEALGFRCARNAPYAGGYITLRHGRPEANVHALQIEIDRAAYLKSDMRTPNPAFDDVALMIASVAEALARRIDGLPLAIAAE